MSALGHKRSCAAQNGMPALLPKADMCGATRDVRFGPKSDNSNPMYVFYGSIVGISASISKRAGLRSPDSAASTMRSASNVLLDCACCSEDNELHAKSSASCIFLTVSELRFLHSVAIKCPPG